MDFNTVRIGIAEFLQIVLFQNEFIYFDLWAIMHFFVGMILIWIFIRLFKMKGLKKFFWLFLTLALWEVFEFVMYGVIKSPLFRPEILNDVATDIVIGMIGGIIMAFYLWFKKKKIRRF